MTTEASTNGTQALGTVHKKVEEAVAKADREFVLNVLNYDMTDIFAHMGINTAGGKFCFPEKKDVDPNTAMSVLTQLHTTFSLPIDDDYLYEKFGVEKPKNYEQQKKLQLEEKNPDGSSQSSNSQASQPPTSKFKDRLRSFFVKAPKDGAHHLDW